MFLFRGLPSNKIRAYTHILSLASEIHRNANPNTGHHFVIIHHHSSAGPEPGKFSTKSQASTSQVTPLAQVMEACAFGLKVQGSYLLMIHGGCHSTNNENLNFWVCTSASPDGGFPHWNQSMHLTTLCSMCNYKCGPTNQSRTNFLVLVDPGTEKRQNYQIINLLCPSCHQHKAMGPKYPRDVKEKEKKRQVKQISAKLLITSPNKQS